GVTARVLPAALAFVAVLADSHGRHEIAYWLVVAAVPAAACAALSGFGTLVEALPRSDEEARARALTALGGLALALVVLAAAVRSPAHLDRTVPALGSSALVAALALYGFQAVVALTTRLEELRLLPARERA
ncbi:MAG: hypothetical protein QOK13_1307, partial [Gaiellaceae bacterium]|nr:hypothetical protein [Gaiellaceae bacterium]